MAALKGLRNFLFSFLQYGLRELLDRKFLRSAEGSSGKISEKYAGNNTAEQQVANERREDELYSRYKTFYG